MLLSGGRLASALMALITMRAVTTFLTPEQYGELALLLVVQTFCGLFLVNPVGQYINIHTHAWWDDGSLMARFRSYSKYILVVALVGLVIVLGLAKQASFSQVLWTSVAMFAMVVAGTWNATLIPLLNMMGFRAAAVLWGIVTVVIGLISSVLLVLWISSATAWFFGQVIGLTVGALGAKYALHQHMVQSKFAQGNIPLLDINIVKSYCLPLAIATGLMWMQLSGYRFLIERYWGLAQLGFLVVGLQLAGQVWALVETFTMQFIYPLFYRRVSAHENQSEVESAFSDLLNTLIPVYCVLAGLVILSAPYLLKVLVAPQFQGAVIFVMLGVGIETFRVLGNLFSNAAHVKRKTGSLTLPYAVGAVIIAMSIFFAGTWKLNIEWAGVGLLMGGLAMFVVMVMNMYQQIKFSLNWHRIAVGVALMLAMILLAINLPHASGLVASIAMLLIYGALTAIIVLLMLRRNPATQRLLNVKLRNK